MINAPEFPTTAQWLNVDQPMTLAQLKGHVIVLDFWTYCCINCIHVMPDLKYLEEKFHGQPVVIIGVHAAKFLNEHNPEHIQSAIDRYEIEHPVIVDSDHKIWDSYAVRAWPTLVVIDTEGKIVEQFSGEGHRNDLQTSIEKLLKSGAKNKTLTDTPVVIKRSIQTSTTTLQYPGKIAFDPTGQLLFISDSNHNRILVTKLLDSTKAEITHLIGTPTPGKEDGDFTVATFNHPQGMVLSGEHLYVCDTENHLIRDINLAEETVTTLAGTGQQASFGASGGKGTQTALSSPWDIIYDDQFLYIAMAGLHQIWRYDFNTQEIKPYAGNGGENLVDGPRMSAQLAQTSGITIDPEHQLLYFADSEASAIRSLSLKTEKVETLVGEDLFSFGLKDGTFKDGQLQHCLGVTYSQNQIYVADTYNHAIRQLDPQTKIISTLIKKENKTECKIGDLSCSVLPLNEPNDVKLQGKLLYIADTNNHLVRVLDLGNQQLMDVNLVAKEAATIETEVEPIAQT